MTFRKKITSCAVVVVLVFCLYQLATHFLTMDSNEEPVDVATDSMAEAEHLAPLIERQQQSALESVKHDALGQRELATEVVTELVETAPTGDLDEADGVDEADAPTLPFNASNSVTMHLDPPLRDFGAAWLNDSGRNDFSMPVPGGRELPIHVERFVAIGEDGGEFIGVVEGYPGSSVKLSYRGDGEAGTIRLPSENRMYVLVPGEDGSVVFRESANSESRTLTSPPVLPSSIPAPPNFIPPPPPQGFRNFTRE